MRSNLRPRVHIQNHLIMRTLFTRMFHEKVLVKKNTCACLYTTTHSYIVSLC